MLIFLCCFIKELGESWVQKYQEQQALESQPHPLNAYSCCIVHHSWIALPSWSPLIVTITRKSAGSLCQAPCTLLPRQVRDPPCISKAWGLTGPTVGFPSLENLCPRFWSTGIPPVTLYWAWTQMPLPGNQTWGFYHVEPRSVLPYLPLLLSIITLFLEFPDSFLASHVRYWGTPNSNSDKPALASTLLFLLLMWTQRSYSAPLRLYSSHS